jgi:DNA-directed RNA polymerase specialized sigma24 family protein
MEYIKNSDFLKMLVKYQKTKDRKVANEIGKQFILIAERFIKKANFIDYTDDRKNEMISDATYYMWRFIDRFDVSKDNPFSYFTTVAKNAFLQYLNERKKYDKMFTSIDYIEFFKNNENNIEE